MSLPLRRKFWNNVPDYNPNLVQMKKIPKRFLCLYSSCQRCDLSSGLIRNETEIYFPTCKVLNLCRTEKIALCLQNWKKCVHDKIEKKFFICTKMKKKCMCTKLKKNFICTKLKKKIYLYKTEKKCMCTKLKKSVCVQNWKKVLHVFKTKQGSGAEDSVGPHSGRPVLLWPTMKIWIVCFHF